MVLLYDITRYNLLTKLTPSLAVSYLDIMGDILLGSTRNPGILSPLTHQLPSSYTWVMDRRLVLAVLVVAVLLPLCCRRHMGSLGLVNIVGLVALATFGLALVWLAVAAMWLGQVSWCTVCAWTCYDHTVKICC